MRTRKRKASDEKSTHFTTNWDGFHKELIILTAHCMDSM
jgi:hypothetical protein